MTTAPARRVLWMVLSYAIDDCHGSFGLDARISERNALHAIHDRTLQSHYLHAVMASYELVVTTSILDFDSKAAYTSAVASLHAAERRRGSWGRYACCHGQQEDKPASAAFPPYRTGNSNYSFLFFPLFFVLIFCFRRRRGARAWGPGRAKIQLQRR